LGWPFEDLDDRIQAREGRTVEQIFGQSGEPAFRQAETAALRELVETQDSAGRIVALGGGAFVQPQNAVLLTGDRIATVFLDGEADELYRRCHKQEIERPLRGTLKQFQALYDQRRPKYMEATVRVDTAGKDVEQVAAEVAQKLDIPLRDSGVM